jgi:hypothetical protein
MMASFVLAPRLASSCPKNTQKHNINTQFSPKFNPRATHLEYPASHLAPPALHLDHPAVHLAPLRAKSEPTGAQKEPSGAKTVPKVSQRMTKIIKKPIFGKGREKGAKLVRRAYELWHPFGATFHYKSINKNNVKFDGKKHESS